MVTDKAGIVKQFTILWNHFYSLDNPQIKHPDKIFFNFSYIVSNLKSTKTRVQEHAHHHHPLNFHAHKLKWYHNISISIPVRQHSAAHSVRSVSRTRRTCPNTTASTRGSSRTSARSANASLPSCLIFSSISEHTPVRTGFYNVYFGISTPRKVYCGYTGVILLVNWAGLKKYCVLGNLTLPIRSGRP